MSKVIYYFQVCPSRLCIQGMCSVHWLILIFKASNIRQNMVSNHLVHCHFLASMGAQLGIYYTVGPFTKPTKTIPKLPNLYKICIKCIQVWYLVIGLVKGRPFSKPYTKQKGPFTKPSLKFTWVIPIDCTNPFIIVFQ